ncbi:FAD-dependent oxidoreductase [Desulforegula conservatrix]|uniref:FAD-dependent oxidoreductase n=1 Tax=Desulforegula conservatrix TaxID=153026 RepID=UPI0003FAEE7B|nr:FAD-dependent oxidoreductase [Desulforegula conservatrix]
MKKAIHRTIVLSAIIAAVIIFVFFDLGHYLTFDYLKEQQHALDAYYSDNRIATVVIYMLAYIIVTAFSLPGAAVMSLAGGALLGFWAGVIAVSFASTIGATLAFLTSRFLLGNYVQAKFGDRLKAINEGMKKDGAFYLFSLRLVPVFPFFIVNLIMGLTPIKPIVYYLVSQIGMFPATLVFINAGTRLGQLESASGILSPSLLFSFALLGLFPLIAKKSLDYFKSGKILSKYPKPKKFDYNLVVIGAGAAGLVSSYIAATVKAKVAIIEKHKMGGDCLNTGCVPSKALIRSAKIISYAKRAREFGFKSIQADFDFSEIMERIKNIIRMIEPHDSTDRYTALGVECIKGEARITSPYTVEVNGRVLTTRSIIIATGARPFVPELPGLEKIEYLTSDNIWNLEKLPESLVVLGGGPIGCELAQSFARLGSKVTQIEMMQRFMTKEDPDVSEFIMQKLESDGVRILSSHRAKEIRVEGDKQILVCDFNGVEINIEFDQLLFALGRAANISGFGLEELGVEITPARTISTNNFLQTNYPNILCAGDVAGPFQFTHVAAHQAWYASVNSLFGWIKKIKADYRVIPWATYTDPEVARVGLNEDEARVNGIKYELTRYGIADLDRAIADSEASGFIKILTKPGSDRILGVTIVGNHASDIISEYVFAMKYELGLNKILGAIHIYPTMAEANKYAAGEWKKARAPRTVLGFLEKIHGWRRGV